MAQVVLRESETRELYESFAGVERFSLDPAELQNNVPYVVKVDQLISSRFKKGLVKVGISNKEVSSFIAEKKKEGYEHFIIEPCLTVDQERYVSFETYPEYDLVRYTDHGGVHVEDSWNSMHELKIPILAKPETVDFPSEAIKHFYTFFVRCNFSFLEINPYGYREGVLCVLDFKARIDNCADKRFSTAQEGTIKEERYIRSLDELTSASLKFSLLNKDGKIWPLIAGGGASLVYFDLITNLFGSKQIAFYGEYSGNPSTQLLYRYTKTVLALMLTSKAKDKVLVIGGGNANFTYIPNTFKGIMQALEEVAQELRTEKTTIIVRRAGPYDKEGLAMMRAFLEKHKLRHFVYGLETRIEDTFKEYLHDHAAH